jgi:DNA-binding transcriptional regulator YiaG
VGFDTARFILAANQAVLCTHNASWPLGKSSAHSFTEIVTLQSASLPDNSEGSHASRYFKAPVLSARMSIHEDESSRSHKMDANLFAEPTQSLREAVAISQGQMPASRRFRAGTPDVRRVRQALGCTQKDFSQLMGISVRTLYRWEHHKTLPNSSALAQLLALRDHPEATLSRLRTELEPSH